MLIPVSGEFARKSIPYAAIALILANVFVFFAFQLDDRAELSRARSFYLSSGLARIEYAYYLKREKGRPVRKTFNDKTGFDPESKRDRKLISRMLSDHSFRAALRDGRLIRPGDPHFQRWQELSARYDQLMQRVTTHGFGLVPTDPAPWSWITYMFLHGGFGHLLGNMVFLWLVGFLLESGCGWARFLGFYFLGGLVAAWLFWMLHQDMTGPLVGASGAISGIMGATSVAFGMQRIRVFLTLGFYFNYFRMPAIFLLPAWLGKELYHLLRFPDSNVAFTAHIGGLCAGAALGYANRRLLGFDPQRLLAPARDETSVLLERGMEAVREIDFASARDYFTRVLQRDPRNLSALRQLFSIESQSGNHERLSEVTNRLLKEMFATDQPGSEIRSVYLEYSGRGGGIRLQPMVVFRLATLFLEHGDADRAERLLGLLLKSRPGLPGIPNLLLRLARLHRARGNAKKYRSCVGVLLKRYADSQEAALFGAKAGTGGNRTDG